MNSLTWRRSAVALAVLSASLASVPASALEGDRIRPHVGAVYTYSDNVFYLDDRSSGGTLLKNGKRSDQTLGLQAGLDIDHYVSRQTFSLRSQLTDTRHNTYDSLDYLAYNARGTWNWVYGDRWDGDAGIEKTQVASNLYDFRTGDRTERNLRNQTQFFGSALLRMSPDWKLRGALRYSNIDNSLSRFNTQDRQEWVAEAGSRRYSKGTDDFIGLNFRYLNGTLPNRVVTATSTIDNAYQQYTAEGVIDYQFSGLTRLSGNLGFTSRRYKQLSQRNFDGITGRLSAGYTLSSKTSLNGAVFREIGAWEDLTTNFVLTQGFSLGAAQSLSDKLVLQLNYSLRKRSFLGDPDFVTVGTPTRKDTFNSLSASLLWSPLRNVRVNGTFSYDRRTANDAWVANGFGPFNDFTAKTVSVSGQLTF